MWACHELSAFLARDRKQSFSLCNRWNRRIFINSPLWFSVSRWRRIRFLLEPQHWIEYSMAEISVNMERSPGQPKNQTSRCFLWSYVLTSCLVHFRPTTTVMFKNCWQFSEKTIAGPRTTEQFSFWNVLDGSRFSKKYLGSMHSTGVASP